MKKNIPLESWEQEQFFKWVYANQIKYPELQLVSGSMNGMRVGPAVRSQLKKQGLRRGIPDIDVPVARHGSHGLKIELKRVSGGAVSEDQERMHELLKLQGYSVIVCYGWRNAVDIIKKYLNIK